MALTAKQEAFAQAVAAGTNLSDAYRKAYSPSPTALPQSIHQLASHLNADVNVASRIQELKADYQSRIRDAQAWTLERLIETAEEHRKIAVSGGARTIPAANGALELIGKATGLLRDRVEVSGQVNHVHSLAAWSVEELEALVRARDELMSRFRVVDQLPEGRPPGEFVTEE